MCGAGAASGMASMGNAMHAISIHDVATDTVHQFAPTYRDYVLYSDTNNPDDTKEPPKTFRAKTFVPINTVRICPSLASAACLIICRARAAVSLSLATAKGSGKQIIV